MGIKNKMVGIALALGAAVAPLAVKANTETNATPKAVELSRAEKATKLKEAIKSGASRDELLKYVDFPKWMPVTQDGQYDKDKADKMYRDAGLDDSKNQQAFIDYMAVVEKGANPDIEFQKFVKQITGGNAEQMAALNQIKDVLQKTQEGASSNNVDSGGKVMLLMLMFAGLGITGARLGTLIASKDEKMEPIGAIVAMITVAGVLISGVETGRVRTIADAYDRTSEQLYNAYANQEIQKAANPKVVQMDMQQAKQFIELTKGQVK